MASTSSRCSLWTEAGSCTPSSFSDVPFWRHQPLCDVQPGLPGARRGGGADDRDGCRGRDGWQAGPCYWGSSLFIRSGIPKRDGEFMVRWRLEAPLRLGQPNFECPPVPNIQFTNARATSWNPPVHSALSSSCRRCCQYRSGASRMPFVIW